MTKNWKIYYDDGSTFSGEQGSPADAPKTGVQVIVVSDELLGRRLERSEDFYIWTPECGGWRGANQFRLSEYLFGSGWKLVLFGKTLTDSQYTEILNKAADDKDIPAKSAWSKLERRPV